jgi:hypothetical protein
MEFILLSSLMNEYYCFCDNIIVIMFVGSISEKPSQDFTLPLRRPRGLKGLLHMLNAIVFPAKEEVV